LVRVQSGGLKDRKGGNHFGYRFADDFVASVVLWSWMTSAITELQSHPRIQAAPRHLPDPSSGRPTRYGVHRREALVSRW
jgi:hypothetical protein